MLATLAFGLDLTDGSDRLDPRTWKAVAQTLLARHGEGVAVCDARLALLYCSSRAQHLLGRLGMGPERILPDDVVRRARELLDAADPARVDRLSPTTGANAIELHASLLRDVAPAHVVLYLREEQLRDDSLYAVLAESYGISLRAFQLAQLVRRGLTNREIAEQLHLTESTVKIYLHQLYRACGVSRRTGLVALLDRLSR